MKKNKKFSMENKYTFVDAFRCFFILLIVMTVVSFIFQIVLSIYVATSGLEYDTVANSTTVNIISSAMSPIIFIVLYFVYNKCKKVNNRVALSDGQ